jgi:septal ring factor EnvC (AmiA/AmiB activator)
MHKRLVAAAIGASCSLPVAAQTLQVAPIAMQPIENRAAELNTAEIRLAKMEARINKLETENAALKSQIDEMTAASARFVKMPEGCRSGTIGGISLGVDARFHRNSFPYYTC